MNKKLTNVLRTNVTLYFICLVLFALAAIPFDVRLAIGEGAAAVVLLIIARRRSRSVQQSMRQYMDRFAGGMEKQATTMKGLWSTVTGVTKSALANMVGITSDGSIRSGSDTLLCFRPLQRQLTDTVAIIDQMFAQCRKQGKYRSRAENPQQKIRRKAHNAKALPERLIHKEQQKNLRDHRNRRHLNAVDFETGAQVAPLLLDNKQENQLLHRPI